jgi:flap endonuclease-1
MGITDLNYLIKQFDKNSVVERNFYELRNKRLAVDLTLFLYKSIKLGLDPLEYIFRQVNHLNRSKITPIYVFDGRPPKEKWAEIKKRNDRKQRSIEVINFLEGQSDLEDINVTQKICELKQNSVSIDKNIKNDIKIMLDIMEIRYIEPPYAEADKIIGELYKNGEIDGCISEDNDMLVYGCNKLYRFYKLNVNRLFEYDLDNILIDLDITYAQFIDMCILSGSDYYKNIKYNSNFRSSVVAHYLIKKYDNLEAVEKLGYVPNDLNFDMIRNIYTC